MAQAIITEWDGREYDHDPKSADWYWALGIVATAATIASALFGNYLFAIVIIAAAMAIALHAAKVPAMHHFRLVDTGLMIGDDLHLFSEMLSFCVLEDIEGTLPPVLSVRTKNWHSSHLEIPLEGVDVDLVHTYFLHQVREEEHHPTFPDLVAAWLGF